MFRFKVAGTLDALCKDENNLYVPTNIDVNSCENSNCSVYNNKGKLTCGYSEKQYHGPDDNIQSIKKCF